MTTEKTNREYCNLNLVTGYPADKSLFYECLKCGDVVPSKPADSTHCKCRNIMIDTDYGRVDVQDTTKVRLFKAIRQAAV